TFKLSPEPHQSVVKCLHEANSSNSAEAIHSTYCRYEIHLVIKFITLHHKFAAEIHRQLVETYGTGVMSRQHIYSGLGHIKMVAQTVKVEDYDICLLGQKRGFIRMI
ncbi:hypothetical protein AAG570_000376, partial [Ranatra chinensis]